jgi:integrase
MPGSGQNKSERRQGTNLMGKEIHKLTALEVKALSQPGRYGDGGNLFLTVSPSGAKAWAFIYRWHGRTRTAGLGSLDKVPLKTARERATEGRNLLGKREDPLAVWQAKKRAADRPTFQKAVDEYFTAHRSEWRSDRHAAEWKRSIAEYCKPLMRLKVDQIEADDVLACLQGPWKTSPETASRVRGRVERVLSAAKAAGHIHRDKLNVARWGDNLEHRLAKKPKVRHFRALDYQDAPRFVAELRGRRFTPEGAYCVNAFALEFCILYATRSNETLGAHWDEIDLDARHGPAWTIPAARTKRLREHVVPLTDAMLAILREMEAIKNAPFVIPGRGGNPPRRCAPFIFPGHVDNAPLGPMAFVTLLRRMKVPVTAHGFRSTIRDFLGNETSTPRDVCEAVLAHQVGNPTEAAYRRSDAIAKRRIAMDLWDAYLKQPADNVIPITKRA